MQRLVLVLFSLILAASPALSVDVSTGWVQGQGGYYSPADRSGPYAIGPDGVARLRGGANQGTASIATSQATTGTAATLLVSQRNGRGAVTIENLGTTPVYIGNSGVTVANGFLIPGSAGASVTIPTGAAIYGIVGTGSQAVSILETY